MLGHVTDPSAPGGLALRELPEPEAEPDQVVVGVEAYAVNRGELHLLQIRPDGWQPGQDHAGAIVKAAADGSGPPEGTRVVGLADGGAWSERVAVPSHRVAALPEGVDFEQAAALPVAGLTALRALHTGGAVVGRRVLVTGASGGVGTFAVQLARIAGAEVTGLVSQQHRVAAVEGLGANAVTTALDEEVGPFDVVLDGVGGKVMVDAIHRLAPRGTVVAYGLAGEEPSTLSFRDFGSAPFGRLVAFRIYFTDHETMGRDLGALARLVGEGSLSVPLGVRLDWSDTMNGVEALRRREVEGKVVFTVSKKQ
jgi:NADPH:quinone reductase-like Zn-dependent oxidoreductase